MAGYTLAGALTLVVETTTNDLAASWRNSIDIWVGPTGSAPDPVADICDDFKQFMQGVQRDDCFLSRWFLRNWARGAGLAGSEVAIWDEPLNIPCKNWGTGACFTGSPDDGAPTLGEVSVLMVKSRASGGGRKHHMSLRNVLWEGLLTNQVGQGPIINPANLTTVTNDLNAWAGVQLSDHFDLGVLPAYCLVDASVKHSIVPVRVGIGSIAFVRATMRNLHNSAKK